MSRYGLPRVEIGMLRDETARAPERISACDPPHIEIPGRPAHALARIFICGLLLAAGCTETPSSFPPCVDPYVTDDCPSGDAAEIDDGGSDTANGNDAGAALDAAL